MSRRENQVEVVASCTRRSQALGEYVQQNAHIPIDGVVHKASAVTAIFQACIDTRKTLAAVRAEEKTALAAVAAADAERSKADKALAPWVKAQFGADSAPVIAFGFQQKAPAVRQTADKARAAELARATRKARGTVSKKEKAKIKGVLPVIAPVVVAPTSTAQPVTNGVAAHA